MPGASRGRRRVPMGEEYSRRAVAVRRRPEGASARLETMSGGRRDAGGRFGRAEEVADERPEGAVLGLHLLHGLLGEGREREEADRVRAGGVWRKSASGGRREIGDLDRVG